MSDTGGSSLSSSLTDLMTSLAVIFVLLLVASLNNLKTSDTRVELIRKLQQMLRDFEAQGVKVEKDPSDPLTLLVLVPEKDLLEFDFREADIRPKGLEFIREFSPRLASVVCSGEFRNDIGSIVVEGHADSHGTDQANLDVSQRRSSAVVIETLNVLQEIETKEPTRQQMEACFKKLSSATGRGSADPVLTADGVEDRDRSRRVVFKIRIRSIEERQLQELVGLKGSGSQ